MVGDEFGMVREAADLRQFAEEHLSPIGRGHECPACHSGTGPNGTPAFSIMPDGKRWKCFSCERTGDVFDLYGILNGTEDRREQLEGVARWAGVELEERGRGTERAGATKGSSRAGSGTGPGENQVPIYRREREARERAATVEEGRRRSAEYASLCRNGIGHPEAAEYMAVRGISPAVAERHGLGYDPERHRLVIPYPGAPWYHTARDVTGAAPNKYSVPGARDVGEAPVWDVAALRGRTAFVVEGQLDAIAVAECGGRAICTNGTKDIKRVAAAVAKRPGCFLYLMFDSDAAGRGECDSLLLELERLGAYSPGCAEEVECPYPDPWEWYAADPEGMRAAVRNLLDAAPEPGDRAAAFAREFEPEGGDAAEWLGGSAPLSTGIAGLDAALGGGLYSGLHILAAPPGAGKSSLAIQIAVNAVVAGAGVLYVSLEMPRADVVARCAAYCSMAFAGDGCEPFTFAEFERAGASLARAAGGDAGRAREMANAEPRTRTMLDVLESLGHVFLYRFAIADGRDGSLSDADGVVALMGRAARAGCSLAVVDYLQYVDAGEAAAADGKAERDGYVAKRLTEAAKRLDMKVLALSSVTKAEGGRGARDADPFSAKGSSDIGHDAVTVMRLEHDPEPQQAGNTVLTLKVAKNRKGPSGGTVQLAFWAGHATVRDM